MHRTGYRFRPIPVTTKPSEQVCPEGSDCARSAILRVQAYWRDHDRGKRNPKPITIKAKEQA